MTGNTRLPDDLGQLLRARREELGLSKSALADKAGKVREVAYRLEAGEEVTVSSLLAAAAALGLSLRLERRPAVGQRGLRALPGRRRCCLRSFACWTSPSEKLFAGHHQTKTYPTSTELMDFGRRIYGVAQPAAVVARIAEAMRKTLEEAKTDARVLGALWAQMAQAWEEGYA